MWLKISKLDTSG